MIKKLALIIFILFMKINLFGEQGNRISCGIDYSLMELIAKAERSSKREVGYPYLISFNKGIVYEKYIQHYKYQRLDSRSIDCMNIDNCVSILNSLISQRVTNIDLGAFQLNYNSHKIPQRKYFHLESSYEKACSILEDLVSRYGYSWETIARYHSSTDEYNRNYRRILANIIASKE